MRNWGKSFFFIVAAAGLMFLTSCGNAGSPGLLAPAPSPSPTPTSGPCSSLALAPARNEWTWECGSNSLNQPGVYGTQGVPSASNTPGPRMWASSWTDVAGNLWLFGGEGVPTPSGVPANFNDLWKYSGGEWTWVGGSNQIEQTGVYGTLATPAPGNVPGRGTMP